jgi:hypothetical protein
MADGPTGAVEARDVVDLGAGRDRCDLAGTGHAHRALRVGAPSATCSRSHSVTAISSSTTSTCGGAESIASRAFEGKRRPQRRERNRPLYHVPHAAGPPVSAGHAVRLRRADRRASLAAG